MPRLLGAPRTILNKSLSGKRNFHGTQVPLEQVKRIKNAVDGATVNDVMLAACAGAFRHYLQSRNALPKNSDLNCLAPISLHKDDEKDEMGNNISGMVISLATRENHPYQRLKRVMESSRTGKELSRIAKPEAFIEQFPYMSGNLFHTAYAGLKLNRLHKPVFNTIVTNIPGPQFPLFLDGARLVEQYPTPPIYHGVGTVMGIFSYNGYIYVSVSGCAKQLPDPDVFCGCIKWSLHELEMCLAKEGLLEMPADQTPQTDVVTDLPARTATSEAEDEPPQKEQHSQSA